MSTVHDHIVGLADKKISDPNVDSILSEVEEIPPVSLAASKWLTDIWIRLGKPDTPFTDSGKKLVNVIIATWEELYPYEAKYWYEERRNYKKNELDITTQVHKGTGRSLASFPYPVFQMLRKVFPDIKFGDRRTAMRMARTFPIFQMANKI